MKIAFSIIGILVSLAIVAVGVLSLTGKLIFEPAEDPSEAIRLSEPMYSESFYSMYKEPSYSSSSPRVPSNYYSDGYAAFGGDFYTYVNNNAAKAAYYAGATASYAEDAAHYAKDAAAYAKDTAHYAKDTAGYMKSAAQYSKQTADLAYMTAFNSALTHKLISILVIGFGSFGVCLFAGFLGGKKQPAPVAAAPHYQQAPVQKPAQQAAPFNPAYTQPGTNPAAPNPPMPNPPRDEQKTI